MNARCTGHCCTHFYFHLDPDGLLDLYERYQAGTFHNPDVVKITDMLRWQGRVKFGKELPAHHPGGYYGCKWFDGASGNCTNYANRPDMCADYPYGHACEIPQCTKGSDWPPDPRLYALQMRYGNFPYALNAPQTEADYFHSMDAEPPEPVAIAPNKE